MKMSFGAALASGVLMSFLASIIQGVVQGLTEFLPVSSSGHLLIAQHILGFGKGEVGNNLLFFNVMLHLGTLIAVLAVYRKEVTELLKAFFRMVSKIFKKEFDFKKMDESENMVVMIIVGLLPLFMLFLPIFGTGMNIKGIAEELSSEKNILIVGVSLVFTSFLLRKGIKAETSAKISAVSANGESAVEGRTRLEIMDAISIGVMQFVAAIFPGISRSGSTLSVALMRGINKKTALDYSFILGIPAIVAAVVLELKEAIEQDAITSSGILPTIVGMVVSAVVGFYAIKLFKWLLKTDKMNIFVIYTLIVGVISVLIGIIEMITGVNLFTGLSV